MKESGGRLEALTGLRFFAACAVVHLHTAELYAPAGLPGASVLWMQAVSFFFVLSGFILCHVYPRLDDRAARSRFLVARFARVYPVYLLALAILVLAVPRPCYVRPPGGWVVTSQLTMTQSWGLAADFPFALNTPAWSISTELGFYLCFPLLIHRFRETWHWKLALAGLTTLAVVCVCQGSAFAHLPLSARQSWFAALAAHPAARLFEFVLGMCLARAWSRFAPAYRPGRGLGTAAELAAVGLAVASVAMAGEWVGALDRAVGLGEAGAVALRNGLSSVPAFGVLVFVMACGRGRVAGLLAARPMVVLGEASFALYLIHFPAIRWLAVHRATWEGLPSALVVGGLWAGVIAASVAAHFLWERPMRRRIVAWWAPARQEAAREPPRRRAA